MKELFLTVWIGALLYITIAQISLYPPVDPKLLARAYNVTPACITALYVKFLSDFNQISIL